jgi:uncharacterized protein (TIGR02569 family)
MSSPSSRVLVAFGCRGPARALGGGEGLTWHANGVVLKRVHDDREATWCQEMLAGLVEDGFRRPTPIRAADGHWVVDEWSACAFLDGLRDGRPQWSTILSGGARFHRALPAPDAAARQVLDQRNHRWAIADRVAWGETTVELSPAATLVHLRIIERLAPLDLEDRLIHGDLTGNVLLDTDDLPVVIDFSPYLRPARYADAIVIGDAMLWEGADLGVLDLLGRDEIGVQLLLRALTFRLVAEQLSQRPRHRNDLRTYTRVLTWLDL